MIHIIPISLLQDNYAFLLVDQEKKECAVIDPSEYLPIKEYIDHFNLKLIAILVTHHHYDHVGGIEELVNNYKDVQVYCSDYDFLQNRVPCKTKALKNNETFDLLGHSFLCLSVPGHTLGAITYYSKALQAMFTGDTLFTAGCGRLFEGSAEQMYHSLSSLSRLPPQTKIYCGHEYTLNNLNFALSLKKDDPYIQDRLKKVEILRKNNKPTVPEKLEIELKTNPFLQADSDIMKHITGKNNPVDVFSYIRHQKDIF